MKEYDNSEMFESTVYKVDEPNTKNHWKDVIFSGIDDKFEKIKEAVKFDVVRRA